MERIVKNFKYLIYILVIMAVEILKYKVEQVKENFHNNYLPWGILVPLYPLKRSGHPTNQFSKYIWFKNKLWYFLKNTVELNKI